MELPPERFLMYTDPMGGGQQGHMGLNSLKGAWEGDSTLSWLQQSDGIELR